MASAPLLHASDLQVTLAKRTLLDRVSFALRPGDTVALIGPNGAGKSTLLKALAGIVPYQGQLLLHGRMAGSLSPRERARLVAYVPQHSALDAPLRVRDVVAQGRFPHRDPWGRPAADDDSVITAALQATDAASLAERPFTGLSYGERRLVLLARALASGARILLLDEPTAALDVAHALSLLHRLRDLASRGHAVVVALHHLDEVRECCSQVILLRRGCVFLAGAVDEVVSPGPVREVFGVELVPGARSGYRLAGDETP
jgi:iron complex transport system ATP-binding protein